MSNLKLDIIYYRTSSDFEMEFNLSGCCRMRTFKDKVDTPRGLINTLARDVARSKIILIVTDLSGDGCGVPLISKSVGLSLIAPNKEEFGITTADEILIPETAVPLVTKSGIYGGCIIESGPQSIIIVSSVRTLRHEIMKAYVHNYVFDIGQMLAYEERMQQSGNTTSPSFLQRKSVSSTSGATDTADALAEKNDSEVNTENTTDDESFHDSTANVFSTADPDEDIFSSSGSSADDTSHRVKNSRRKSGRASNIVLLIIVVLLLVGFGILAYFLIYMPLIGGENVFSGETENVITEFFTSLF